MEKVKNSSPKNLSVDCWSTVGQLSFTAFYENLLLTVGRLLAACQWFVGQVSVENPCWIPEKPQLAGKNIAYRREMKLSLFESAILFSFFRDQSPRNLLCLGFLGTKPLTIPSHHPRSQEAKICLQRLLAAFFFALLNRNIINWSLLLDIDFWKCGGS